MGRDDVLVRWIEIERIDAACRDLLKALLSEDERRRAAAFRKDEDALAYAAAHALVRGVLTELAGRPPLSWAFRIGAFGKPSPVAEVGAPSVQTSLSHTKGLAITAGCARREIGVDAEWLGRRAPRDIVENYFSQEEREKFHQCPTAAKTTTFFEIWTLKEAYAKAIGTGLNLPFNSFGFDIDRNRLLFSEKDRDLSRWRFHRFQIGHAHTAALAVGGHDGFQPNVCAGPAEIDWLADLASV